MSLDSKTAEARARTLNTSEDRWSSQKGETGIENLYASGSGSVYTALPAGQNGGMAKAGNLESQRKEGVKFFGYGRGNHTARLGDQGQKQQGMEFIGGQLSSQKTIATGDLQLGGFNTFRSAREAVSDYGSDLLAVCKASWFTKNVHTATKYGNTIMNLGGRGESTRGRTEGGTGSGSGSQGNNNASGTY
jgi:hypothetical protein